MVMVGAGFGTGSDGFGTPPPVVPPEKHRRSRPKGSCTKRENKKKNRRKGSGHAPDSVPSSSPSTFSYVYHHPASRGAVEDGGGLGSGETEKGTDTVTTSSQAMSSAIAAAMSGYLEVDEDNGDEV